MMIRALPDLLSTSLFSRVTSSLRSDLDRTAIEAVTGRRQDIDTAVAGRTGQVHRAQKEIDQTQATQTRLALVTGRYTQAAASYRSIRETANDTGITALQAATAGSPAGVEASSDAAASTLNAMFTALNVRFDGRSLFSGDASASSPLGDADAMLADIRTAIDGASTPADKRAAIDAYFAPGGTFETTVYRGGQNDAAAVTLPDGFRLAAMDRADSPEFRDMMKGLAIVATAVKLPPVEIVAWVRQGADLIRQSSDRLLVSEARLGQTINRLDAAVEKEKDDRLVAESTLDSMIGRDAFEAASEAQNLETRLQAAYTLTSRIGRLSLTNFLR